MRSRLLILCTLVGLTAVIVWQVNSRAVPDANHQGPTAAESGAIADDESEDEPSADATREGEPDIGPNIASYALTTSQPTLPPLDMPLRESFAELERRARAGDAVASCRLSADLARCERLPRERAYTGDAISTAARKTPGSSDEASAVAQATTLKKYLSEDEALCEGFSQSTPHAAWSYLKQAAERGNVHAMVQLAASPPLDSEHFLRDVDQWAEYNEIAGNFLLRAADAGEPFALHQLWWVYAGHPAVGGSQILPRDPYRARVLAYAIQQIGNDRAQRNVAHYLSKNPDSLTIAQDAQAKIDGLELAGSRFSDLSDANLSNFPRRDRHCAGGGH